ncbi:MAG: hypothetical protein ACOCYN_03710 [Planctomycetota bacterium]
MVVLDRVLQEDSLALQPPGRVSDNVRQPPWGWFFAPLPQVLAEPAQQHGPSATCIRRELARLEREGYTLRIQQDRRRLAAPVRDRDGAIIAALAVGGSPSSLPDAQLAEAGDTLASMAASCSQSLC